MKIKIGYIIILSIFPKIVFGQVNLVQNGNFENYKWLPTNYLTFDIDSVLTGWNAPTDGTPDYFYNKIPKIKYDAVGYPIDWSRYMGLPINSEYVLPQNGNGFGGISFLVQKIKSLNHIGTEFLQTQLLQTPKLDHKYRLKIYYRCSKITNSKYGRLGYILTQNELRNKYTTSLDNPYYNRFDPPVKGYTNFSSSNYDTTWQLYDTIITFKDPKNYLTIGGFNIEFHPFTKDTFALFYYFIDNISLHELPIIHGSDTVCINEMVKLYSSYSGPVEWWFNGNLVSTDNIYTFTAIQSGVYFMKTPNDMVSHHLIVVQNTIDEESRVSEICEGENMKVDISDKYKAKWSDGIISNRRIFTDQTKLSVTISDKFCKKDIDIMINKKPLQKFEAPDHLGFCAYDNINYTEVELPEGFTYHWQDKDSSSYRKFTMPGKYVFTFTDTNFCNRKDSIIISDVCAFISWVPNVLAPNGINKDFRPYLEYIERATLVVYNRWGEKIFEESSISPIWDGYSQGKLCQQGVYFYTLEIIPKLNQSPKNLSGKIHLIY